MTELNQSEKKQLRGQAQLLKPAVLVGKGGLTDKVIHEIDFALSKQALIKIRFNGDRESVDTHSRDIAEKTKATFLSTVGKTSSFYRAKPEPVEE